MEKKRKVVVFYKKGKDLQAKSVPASKSLLIAIEYRKKTGKPVTIRLT